MPRQPFLPTYKDYRGYGIGAKLIDQRPDFVAAIGRCLTLWPYVEHQMAMILGILLKADSAASIAVFNVLRSGQTQRDVLAAAASTTLEPARALLFEAVLRVFETTAKERADVAHGHWGVMDHYEDRVLWVESRQHSPWNALVLLNEDAGRPNTSHEGLLQHLFVWRLRDLEEVYEQIEEMWKITFDLVGLLRDSSATGAYGLAGEELEQHLANLPRVAEATRNIERRRQRQQS